MMVREYLDRYNGDVEEMLKHVVVKRLVLSEQDRRGIGTFQPKDEKNQDSTELTGDLNYRKIAVYGSDSDPRAFSFDGEFIVANRGCFECVEMLKLQKEFLYDFLTASQEGRIKPKKFAQVDIDVCILGHTNEPEYRRLLDDKLMEAIVDRMVRIDVPYNTKVSDELKIYERDFEKASQRTHFAPHTLEVASLFAVLSRLEQPKDGKLTLLTKSKLYDGVRIPGYNEESVAELRRDTKREGLDGIGPRFIQDTISSVLVASNREDGINPFMVINAIEKRLQKHPACKTDKEKERFAGILSQVRQEYVSIIKTEVQRVIAADEGAVARLCANYIDNVKAFTQKEKVRNQFTGQMEAPNEGLMRSIEEKLVPPVSEGAKNDFRAEIMNYIGALALEGKRFDYRQSDRLRQALEIKLFEDQKDSIRLSQISATSVDKETQEKIDIVKSRLIRDFGYNDRSARDVLEYVGSILHRGH
jgi:serine protein kinase